MDETKFEFPNQNFRRHSTPARILQQNLQLVEEHFFLRSSLRRASVLDSFIAFENKSESSTSSELDTSNSQICFLNQSEFNCTLEGNYVYLPVSDVDVHTLILKNNSNSWRSHIFWSIWKKIILSHLLSICLAAILLFNSALRENSLLMANGQNFPFYILLSALWTTKLALRNEGNGIIEVIKNSGIRYFCLAIFHVEVNAMLLSTFRHNSYLGNQLIDCVAALLTLFIAYALLEVQFQCIHVWGCIIAIFGSLGFSLIQLNLNNRFPTNLLGDILRAASGVCLAYNSVVQEIIVKAADPVEYTGMMALIASMICGSQAIFFEEFCYHDKNVFYWPKLTAYSIAQFLFQSFMPRILREGSATGFHLTLISTSFYLHCLETLINRNQFQTFYLLPYIAATVGSSLFAVKKTFVGTQNCFPIKIVVTK